jgi:hypothetical protein
VFVRPHYLKAKCVCPCTVFVPASWYSTLCILCMGFLLTWLISAQSENRLISFQLQPSRGISSFSFLCTHPSPLYHYSSLSLSSPCTLTSDLFLSSLSSSPWTVSTASSAQYTSQPFPFCCKRQRLKEGQFCLSPCGMADNSCLHESVREFGWACVCVRHSTGEKIPWKTVPGDSAGTISSSLPTWAEPDNG